MEIPLFQVDAFASRVFAGNPAAVCPLEAWINAKTMQSIAAENNLAETAFFVKGPAGYEIRWFTPAVEIDLCGHATLASAYVLWEYLGYAEERVTFSSRGGPLAVDKQDGRLCLDFPSQLPSRCQPHERLIEGLGTQPLEVLASNYYMAVYPREEDVWTLEPNFDVLGSLDRGGIVVTAPGRDVDFVSRFFAPAFGIPEDPVTGSAHCILTPYWSRRLGKKNMRALQVSRRGGELWVEDRGDRVGIAGHVTPYLRGTITVPV